MARKKPLARALRALCLLAIAPAVSAQEQAAGLEEIIVTGSRIPRPDFESASPVVTVDSEDFKRTAATSVEAVLNRMPQFVPDFGASSNNPGVGGKATISLRGLGANATLVLLDGRRLIPADGNGAVDVNIIPPALLERVEVISGGASAVYGSDAVAGVVNFKLRTDFEGVEINGSWAETDRSDANEDAVGITGGMAFAEGRGHLMGYLGYTDREALSQGERDFSQYSLAYFGPGAGGVGPDGGFLAGGSSSVTEGVVLQAGTTQAAVNSVFGRYGYAAGQVPARSGFAVNADGTLFTVGCGACPPGAVANYRGEQDPLLFNTRVYTYNFAPWNYLQLPLERSSAFGRGSWEFAGGTEAYAQLLYADYSADLALAPTPTGGFIGPLNIPRAYPYVPADLAELLDARANPGASFRLSKRFDEVGPRLTKNDYDVYQFTAGLSGDLPGEWRYEAYAQHGDNDQREEQTGNVLRSRIYELVRAPDGGQSICGEFNLFQPGAISAECASYVTSGGVNRSGYEQSIGEVSVLGPLWTLPAGQMQLVLGLMYKRDEYFYDGDTIAAVTLPEDGLSDIQGFNPSDDIEGSDHNWDVYAELSVPLLADRPGAQSLEALLGYRYSQYDSAGGADAWKAELMWTPVEMVLLRGSAQRAVRAPSVYELYLPRLALPGGLDDPCGASSIQRAGEDAAAVEALCVAQGVPADAIADFSPFGEFVTYTGGNTELEPETAHTTTVGIVLSPDFGLELLAEVNLSIDWYRIEVDDAIEMNTYNTYIPACYDRPTNPGFAADNYWCSYFQRDPASGEIATGLDTLVNFARREVSGIDTQLDWRIPAGPGNIELSTYTSWLDLFEIQPSHGLALIERTGVVGGGAVGTSQPEWKLNMRLGYQWQWLSAGLVWRFVDGMRDSDAENLGWEYDVPSQDYLDLYAEGLFEEGVLEGLSLRAGVENATDEEPPLLPSPVQANTDPSQYDALGRRFYLNLGYRF